jgi:LuxR family maltose regulon positive regulatory protein
MTEPTVVHPAVPVLETKLRRPTVSSLHVARQRLLVQLTASLERRLILVSAPAGYGKTALVSRWLDTVDCPCAWFSVDEHDDNLATFLIYLSAAIRTVAQDALGALELLLSAPTLPAPHRLADTLLQALAALPGPLILALDDYHAVNAPEIHALMVRLVERLPAHVHLVLITRADPPLPLDRLRGRQELGELRAADLRFSTAETRLLLQRMLGPEITAETAALLEEGTEGWAVGLHLAALSLRNRPDPAAFARHLAEHGHQAITEYLLSEVLASLPAVQRDCLLRARAGGRSGAPCPQGGRPGPGRLAGRRAGAPGAGSRRLAVDRALDQPPAGSGGRPAQAPGRPGLAALYPLAVWRARSEHRCGGGGPHRRTDGCGQCRTHPARRDQRAACGAGA